MKPASALIPLGLGASLAAARSSPLTRRQDSDEPCAQLADLQSDGETSYYPADVALQCLRSVPVQTESNKQQLAGLRTFLQFHSTLAYLKDPPEGWLHDPLDLEYGLDQLRDALDNGGYDNEYDFQLDLSKLFAAAYDGHLVYVPDIVDVFSWQRRGPNITVGVLEDLDLYSLVSVSEDGVQVPRLYSYLDLDALGEDVDADYEPAHITQIDGDDVDDWLDEYAATSGRFLHHDPDALYNLLFPNIPTSGSALVAGNGFGFGQALYPQGSETVLTFSNDTERRITIEAGSRVDFSDVSDSESFFDACCNLENPPVAEPATKVSSVLPTPTVTTQVPYESVPTAVPTGSSDSGAFPAPIVNSSEGSVAGYLPEAQSDLAVLAIPNYGPPQGFNYEFQGVVRELLATANANNKTQLVIDVRGNGGGNMFQAYDTLVQLFPDKTPYGTGNFRANDLLDFAGRSVSAYFEDLSIEDATLQDVDQGFASPLDYRTNLNADNEPFTSWSDLYGPETHAGDEFTSLLRYNLTNPFVRPFVPITGYPSLNATTPPSDPQPRTFAPENITLLTDGACASTCAIFAELLKTQAPTSHTVTIGGRPRTGPMQAVGGTKGARVLGMALLQAYVQVGVALAPVSDQLDFFEQYGGLDGELLSTTTQALKRAALGGTFGSLASVNFRNNIRLDDESVTPLQFVYEAAGSRFFYTAAMLREQERVWVRAAEVVWGDAEAVEGSEGEVSAEFDGGENVDAEPAEGTGNEFGVFPTRVGEAVETGEGGSGTEEEGEDSSEGAAAGRVAVSGGLMGAVAVMMCLW